MSIVSPKVCGQRLRIQKRHAADGDAVVVSEARGRCIGYDTQNHAVRKHVIVAGLKPCEEAPGLLEGIEGLSQAERARDEIGRLRPVRTSPRVAEMGTYIESGPIIDWCCAFPLQYEIGGRYRLGHDDRDEHGMAEEQDGFDGMQYGHETDRHLPRRYRGVI